jgi:starch phosphorylase
VKVWALAVGRITLYMLDTDVPENSPDDRLITAQLYGGDHEMRIKQEIVLGIGGIHSLNAMGIEPAAYHMNEGHSAFLSLELIRRGVAEDKLEFLRGTAGRCLGKYLHDAHSGARGQRRLSARFDAQIFRALSRASRHLVRETHQPRPDRQYQRRQLQIGRAFSMTILALRTSRHANG